MIQFRPFRRCLIAAGVLAPALALAAALPTRPVDTVFAAEPVSLAQAIATVQGQTGGQITHAAFGTQDGKSGYLVTASVGGRMHALWVDPDSGEATPIATPSAEEREAESQDQLRIASLFGARVSVAQAISLVEQKTGGRAMNAGLQTHNTAVAIGVEILKDGKRSTVWVDPWAGTLES